MDNAAQRSPWIITSENCLKNVAKGDTERIAIACGMTEESHAHDIISVQMVSNSSFFRVRKETSHS